MNVEWIAVDWGTSNMRAWAMEGASPIAEARSDKGMGALHPSEFEAALLEVITPWLGEGTTRVVACGMVGAKQGWMEAPYLSVPTLPISDRLTQPSVSHPRLSVHILPGLSQDTPADVMRGEETQIAGFLALAPEFDGIICLPGTHTKWVQVSAGEVVSFRTFMSGELFALLANASVLKHSIGEGWDEQDFVDALTDTISRPETLASRLFSLRAEGLLHDLNPDCARARLSGLLIGAELAAARPYWLGQQIALIGDPQLSNIYAKALETQGAPSAQADADRATLAGLTRAYQTLRGTS